jgi:HAD superfamily hydrolase (TIGR01549 family)
MSANNLLEIISKKEIVSFDLYDTLIHRNVRIPEDVFELTEKLYEKETGQAIAFIKARTEAEHKARLKKGIKEISFDDIYFELNAIFSIDQINKLKEIELKIEVDITVPVKKMVEVFKFAQSAGKTVIITSDMYLSADIINQILKKNGILGHSKLFLSSDRGVKKKSGEMYKFLIEECGYEAKKMIHIGDNPNSDIKVAKEFGITTFMVENRDHRGFYPSGWNNQKIDIEDNLLSSFINNTYLEVESGNRHGKEPEAQPTKERAIDSSLKRSFLVGYNTLGPLLFGFCKWLNKLCESKDIKKIFFLSRDGLILKETFEKMYPGKYLSNYLYVSRRSLIVPTFSLGEKNISQILSSMSFNEGTTISVLMEKLGLEYADYADALNEIKPEEIVNIEVLTPLQEAFLNRVLDRIMNNSRNEFRLASKYLKENDFSGKVMVVDIGWKGHMQKALIEICKHSEIKAWIGGAYIGVNPNSEIADEIEMNGYLFSRKVNLTFFRDISIFGDLFESVFLAPHGSVKKYTNSDSDRVFPVFYDYEFEGRPEMAEILSSYRKGALEFVERMLEDGFLRDYDFGLETLFAPMREFGKMPYKEDAKLFGRIVFFNYRYEYLARTEKLMLALRRPKDLVNALKKSVWKVAFMTNLLSLRLPYYLLYKLKKAPKP